MLESLVLFRFLAYLCITFRDEKTKYKYTKKGTDTRKLVYTLYAKIKQYAARIIVFGSFFSTQFGKTIVSRLSFKRKAFPSPPASVLPG